MKVSVKPGVSFRKIPDSFITVKEEATQMLLSVLVSNENKLLNLKEKMNEAQRNITNDSLKDTKKRLIKGAQGGNDKKNEVNADTFLRLLNDQRSVLPSDSKTNFDYQW